MTIMTNALILIDYGNLLQRHRDAGLLDLVVRILGGITWDTGTARGRCDIRIYGGWYEEDMITRQAEELTVEIQRDFPTVIRVSSNGVIIPFSTSADLAMSLLQEPSTHLFRTYRRKERPWNVRVESKAAVGCEEDSCVLPLMKKMLKHGSCPKEGCSIHRTDLLYRHEQKIVDTMLACDMVHATDREYSKLILVSDDDDFIPPLRTVLLKGKSAVRCNPKTGHQRGIQRVGNVQLAEITV
jgi:uncharacterized LabA/DUF88 family protein